MLKNRVYLGEYNWIDKKSGEAFPIVVPQIISHSLFNRVKKKLKENKHYVRLPLKHALQEIL